MRGLQRAQYLEADSRRVPGPEGALLQRVAHRAALHELHHDPRLAVHDRHVVHVDDGRVVQTRRGACLAAHPLKGVGTFAVGKVVRYTGLLDGDLAVHRLVLGPPHRAHAAVPELGEQPVTACDEPTGAGVVLDRRGLRGGLRVRYGPRGGLRAGSL